VSPLELHQVIFNEKQLQNTENNCIMQRITGTFVKIIKDSKYSNYWRNSEKGINFGYFHRK
jgi:hypothetical protein